MNNDLEMSKEEIDSLLKIANKRDHPLQECFLIKLVYIMLGKNISNRYWWLDRKFLSQLYDCVKNMPDEVYLENQQNLDDILTLIHKMENITEWLSTMT